MLYFNRIRNIFCVLYFVLITSPAHASHILGGDLSYSWVSDSTYKISLSIYGDCTSIPELFAMLYIDTPKIRVYDGNLLIDIVDLQINSSISGLDVTPDLCYGYVSRCSSPTSVIPGMKIFVYTRNYVLPHASSVWRFVFGGEMATTTAAGRSNNITNILGASTFSLTDTLNSTIGHNTNPILDMAPPYFSINTPSVYTPAAIDAEGDSIAYDLAPATNATSSGPPFPSVIYVSPYTAAIPIHAAAGSFSFNPVSGQLNFTPNILQCSDVVYNIREYRGGVLAGTMQREINALVFDDSDHTQTGVFAYPTNGIITSPTNLNVCDTMTSISLQILLADTSSIYVVKVTPSGLPAGATFNTVNDSTHNPVSTFSWNLSSVTPGTYTFFVKFKDNACPVADSRIVAYTVMFVPCDMLTSVSPVVRNTAMPFQIYPNPSNGSITIKANDIFQNATISIFDAAGKTVMHGNIEANIQKSSFTLDYLQTGTYTVRIISDNAVYHDKLTIDR